MIRRHGAAVALILAAAPVAAGPFDDLAVAPPGAASCSGCHAAAAATTSVPRIAGRPAGEIASALAAFRAGGRPATVMNRIATGFTEGESEAIAQWLSRHP